MREAIDRFGLEAVAVELRMPPEAVDLWVRGLATLPDREVVALINLLRRIDKA